MEAKATSPLFYPPQLHRGLVRILQWIAPLGVRWLHQFELVIAPEDLAVLRELGQVRSLFLPNHPTFHDPIVMFALSAKLGQPFHYLSAYELLQTRLGSLLQRLGVYSIRRGLLDRPSISQTLSLLATPQCRLVIFPEGGCSFQNDKVTLFRSGAIQLAFQAIGRSVKQQGSPLDIYGVPISIKYRYQQDMQPVIQRLLLRLEAALQIDSSGVESDYSRLRAIAEQFLDRLEQEYGITDAADLTWNDRIDRLRQSVLQRCEVALGLSAHPTEPNRERTYRIESALKGLIDRLESGDLDEADLSGLNGLNGQATPSSSGSRSSTVALMEKSVKRLLNFDAIYDGYVAEQPTPERFLDTLTRLERDVFDIDQPPPKGFRRAYVKVGTTINLADWFADYQCDRTSTINTVTQLIQHTVQTNLDRLNQQS